VSEYTRRPLTLADTAAAAEISNEIDSVYLAEPDESSASDFESWWTGADFARDSLGFDDGGVLAAFGTLRERQAGILGLDAYVRPSHAGQGLGAALLDWLEDEAQRRGLATIHASALGPDDSAAELLTARGFRPIRHFYRMVIDLDAPPPAPLWPEGFDVSTFGPGDEELLQTTLDDAFAEHWGHEDRDLDHWRRAWYERDWWDPTLVYLVRHEGEVVAAEANAIRFGMGFVCSIGTRKPWRGLGLGRALLLQAFGELYRRGERRIGLMVDAGNETGATQLYESAGMRVAWQADVYERRL
jgi:mycothiol synthase